MLVGVLDEPRFVRIEEKTSFTLASFEQKAKRHFFFKGSFFFLILIVGGTGACHGSPVEATDNSGVSCLFLSLLRGFWESNSDHQALKRVFLPVC